MLFDEILFYKYLDLVTIDSYIRVSPGGGGLKKNNNGITQFGGGGGLTIEIT